MDRPVSSLAARRLTPCALQVVTAGHAWFVVESQPPAKRSPCAVSSCRDARCSLDCTYSTVPALPQDRGDPAIAVAFAVGGEVASGPGDSIFGPKVELLPTRLLSLMKGSSIQTQNAVAMIRLIPR